MPTPSLTVYSTGPRCQRCKATQRKLDGAGLVEGVDYDYIDVTLPGNEEHYAKSKTFGFNEAPVVVTPTQAFYGFRPDLLDAEIARIKAARKACDVELAANSACETCDCGAAE